MNTFFVIVDIVALVFATLLLAGSLFLIALHHYYLKLFMSMPVLRWMTLDEVLALGVPRHITLCVLWLGMAAEDIEVRTRKEFFKQVIEDLDEEDIVERDPLRLVPRFRHAEYYEYRLRRKPDLRRRVEVGLDSSDVAGGLMPA